MKGVFISLTMIGFAVGIFYMLFVQEDTSNIDVLVPVIAAQAH